MVKNFMEKMNDLKDLLKHEILDLYSAEEQIIEALPLMIEKAQNKDLKGALNNHLKITEEQKKRLDKIKQLVTDEKKPEQEDEKKGFFSRLFSGTEGKQKCRGMEGLIDEGKKIMAEDISPEALDAAIIGCAQKIEHYEISGYGTAKAYAKELQLEDVEKLLDETLAEEYEADKRLTELAVGRLNTQAEQVNVRNEEQNEPMNESSPKEGTRPNRKEEPGRNTTAKRSEPATKKKESASSRSSASKDSKSTKANSKEKASKGSTQKKSSKSASAKNKKPAKSKSTAKSR